jgi:predicted proteasome-type protease
MSIGIGLIYKNGIILASDGKTEAESGTKRFDMHKISLFSAGNFKCGIVRAGATDLSAQAVDLIGERIKENAPKELFSLRTIVHKSAGDT